MAFKKPKTELVSRNQFAELVGCTGGRVSQAIKEGLISEENLVRDGKRVIGIRWEKAMDDWSENYDQGDNPTSKVGDTMREWQDKKRGGPMKLDDVGEIRALNESKRVEAHYKAEIARMDKEEREGELVRKEHVRKQLHSFGVEVRIAIQSVPDRVVDKVMGSTDRTEVIRTITEEINEQLNKLTEVVERDFSK